MVTKQLTVGKTEQNERTTHPTPKTTETTQQTRHTTPQTTPRSPSIDRKRNTGRRHSSNHFSNILSKVHLKNNFLIIIFFSSYYVFRSSLNCVFILNILIRQSNEHGHLISKNILTIINFGFNFLMIIIMVNSH